MKKLYWARRAPDPFGGHGACFRWFQVLESIVGTSLETIVLNFVCDARTAGDIAFQMNLGHLKGNTCHLKIS